MDLSAPNVRTALLAGLLALVVLGAGTALADALVETDAERLDRIVDVLREGDDARIDRLAGYADAERVAVIVSDDGGTERVRDGELLRDRLHEVLSPLDDAEAELVQVTRNVEGEEGRVTLRVRADGETTDLELTLRRDGQTFLLVGARRIG